MITVCILLVLLVLMCYCLYQKESYKRQRRQGIRMGWKRGGRAGHTLAMKGTRYPKLPKVEGKLYPICDDN